VIGTLTDLLRSGDNVQHIEAVLSGTLNFVFNNYDGKRLFADVVKQAQDEGYTEPDPRLDLSGKDVMRKIMILAREAGEKIEMDDIANNSFMPDSCMQGSVENFYDEMRKHEDHFKKLYQKAEKKVVSLSLLLLIITRSRLVRMAGSKRPWGCSIFHRNRIFIISMARITWYCFIPTVIKSSRLL